MALWNIVIVAVFTNFQFASNSKEVENLNAKPIANASILKERQRIQIINHYLETNYQSELI
jgi:hypothetical protein